MENFIDADEYGFVVKTDEYGFVVKTDESPLLWWILLICLVFSSTAVALSLRLIARHLRHFSQPIIQRKIIAILWMVPIYSVTSWLSLQFIHQSMLLDMIRDCYEGYVIYTFFALCYCYIGQFDRDHIDPALIYSALARKGSVRHMTALVRTFGARDEIDLKADPRGFLLNCKKYILQFVLIKPLGTVAAIWLSRFDLYENGNFSLGNGYLYVTVITHTSISLSLYWMVMFYKATSEALAPFNPIPKFLCIKGVLFFCYWQSVIIAILVKMGWITDIPIIHYTVDHVVSTVQNCLICAEMVGFAVAHSFTFNADSFLIIPSPSAVLNPRPGLGVSSARTMLINAIDIGDMMEDIHEVAPVIPIPRFLNRRNSSLNSNQQGINSNTSTDAQITIPSNEGIRQLEDAIRESKTTQLNIQRTSS